MEMTAEPVVAHKPLDIREEAIPLPSQDDGYATVMLVGTTGAGKTTVLRQLIGSERFPPTSTSRTTTSDIEIVTADGSYEAVITFMDKREVMDEIEKCLHHACRTAVTESRDDRVARALLSPPEQRFRLSYPLGRWEPNQTSAQGELTDASGRTLSDYEATSAEEQEENQEILEDFVGRIRAISSRVMQKTDAAGSTLADARGTGERDAWMSLFDETLETDEAIRELATEILTKIHDRFEGIETGEFTFDETDWPLAWQYHSGDQDDFLTEVRWFSGNNSQQFGRLLTPLVNGVRVRGPFAPADIRLQTNHKLVILDGEGLGHRAQSATSIRSEITDRFSMTDVILLVDNAQQPMLAAPQELVKTAGSMGYASKLAFAFTHFENVIGDDLYTREDREDRVRNPGRDAVETMRGIVGDDVTEDLLERVENYTFFLENMDKPTDQLPNHSIGEMLRLLDAIEAAAHPEAKSTARIRLSSRDLDMAISDAIDRFHEPWQGWLHGRHPDYSKEHWTRIKALTLRLTIGLNGYDSLRPVDDLRSRLQYGVSRWLNRQASSIDDEATQDEMLAALTIIRQRMYAPLQSMAEQRIARRSLSDWERAYDHRGTRSSYRRADDIEAIYRRAAPAIGFDKNTEAQELLNLVYAAIQAAAEEVDGRLE